MTTKVIPLGGLGEFGLNSMVIERPDGLVLVDGGIMFGKPDQPSVDVVYPDFDYLERNADRFRAIVVTHAHEDHVGALPSLLARLPVPVYGTKLTLGFLNHKLEEMGVEYEPRVMEPRERFEPFPGFVAEGLHVTHSMPGAMGYAFHTEAGAIIHTGDFKLDPEPGDGKPTDLERFGELGDEGVAMLLSDSTNAQHEHHSGSEADVTRGMEAVLTGAPGRVIIGMFASSIHRIRNLFGLAEKLGRRVVPYGRSMIRNIELAAKLEGLVIPDGLLITPEASLGLLPSQVLVLATGSQGEPGAGLWQMAYSDGSMLQAERGDIVVMSARAIPGNEEPVEDLMRQLSLRGARVLSGPQDPPVHVSGHGGRPEQEKLIALTRPKTFVPIHGEPQQLHAHLETAQRMPTRALLARDGDVMLVGMEGTRMLESIHVRRRRIDKFTQTLLSEETLKERTNLAELGIVVATVALDVSRRVMLAGPHLQGRGLGPEEQKALEHAKAEVRAGFLELSPHLWGDEPHVREHLTTVVRRAFRLRTGKRPSVLAVVLRL